MKANFSTPDTDATRPSLTHLENQTIRQALNILETRFFERRIPLRSADDVRAFLRLRLAGNQQEVFAVIFLDSMTRLHSFEEMFYGTINSCTIHPREVVKRALALNAASVILCHNHPSGSCLPSDDDLVVTKRLTEALKLVDVRVLDHFIVGCGEPYSFAVDGQI